MNKQQIIFVLFCVSLLTFDVSRAFAQQPTQEWVARYTRNPGQASGPYFVQDKNGNSYLAGTDILNDTINILCCKYNSSGSLLWGTVYKYPGDSYFSPRGLATDTNGNAYVVSTTGISATSAQNILTLKFSYINGSLVWARKYVGQSGTSVPQDIKTDYKNNIYVVGNSDSGALCIKYSTNGDTAWVRKFHPTGDLAYAKSCAIDDSLNIILTGERDHCVTFPPPGGCYDTLLVMKYSPDGQLRWVSTYYYNLNPSVSFGLKVATDQYGNAIVIGRTRRQGSGYYVFLTIKYDSNGNRQWVSLYDAGGTDNWISDIAVDKFHNAIFVNGTTPTTNGQGISTTIKYYLTTGDSAWVKKDSGLYSNSGSNGAAVDSLGNCYVTGVTYDLGTGVFDLVTTKYSETGLKVWQLIYNGPSNGVDNGYLVSLDNQNNIIVCGTSNGPVFQENDYILIKYDQPYSVLPIEQSVPGAFQLMQNFPNPFNSSTRIGFTVPKRSPVVVRIFDVLGRSLGILLKAYLSPGKYSLLFDASSYSTGVYFYQLLRDNEILDTKKLVIIK